MNKFLKAELKRQQREARQNEVKYYMSKNDLQKAIDIALEEQKKSKSRGILDE
jgi:hypothetical protein